MQYCPRCRESPYNTESRTGMCEMCIALSEIERLRNSIAENEKKIDKRAAKKQRTPRTPGMAKNRTFPYPRVRSSNVFRSRGSHGLLRSNWAGVERSKHYRRSR
jgi:hypothetical protein